MDPYKRIARRLRHPDKPIERDAPCVGATDLFYGAYEDLREEPLEERVVREARAKQVCENCFMRLECLSFGLLNQELGVWGGMTPGERREFKKSLKKIYKDWTHAVRDLDTLRWRSEAFLTKRSKERAKQHRESERQGEGRSTATAVAISTGRSSRSGTRPVPQGDRSGPARGKSSRGGGESSRPSANQPQRATRKAAGAKRNGPGRGVQR